MVMKNVHAGNRGRPWPRRDTHLPHSDFPGERTASTYNPGRAQLRPLSSWPAAVSAKSASSPTSHFIDAPFQQAVLYRRAARRQKSAYMGCRTRVIGNVYDPSRWRYATAEATSSFTSINLPRLAIEGNRETWTGSLRTWTSMMDLVLWTSFLERFEIQCRKHVYNLSFPHGPGRLD